MSIKKNILFVHRWLGLLSGLVVVLVALTGSLLAFEDEGRDYLEHNYYHIAHPAAQRLSLDQMVDTFRVYNPKIKISSIRFKETADAAVVFFTKEKFVFMDPYTARITATVPVSSDFFYVIRLLHTQLMLGDVGKTIVHINVLLFFIICLSGLVMWWPRKWSLFRSAASIKFSGSRKRVNYDLHRALGFYALPILLIISFTGLFMAFNSTKETVPSVSRSPIPSLHYSLDSAYAYAKEHYPGARETFIVPATKETPIRVTLRYPYTIVRNQNTLYFNPWDGSLVRTELYANYNGFEKMSRSNYNLHTGKIGPLGIFSQILYCIVALIAASLPITGFYIWLGKRNKKKIVPVSSQI
jgi:uncharacterized iron-regulated membrane protein